MFGSFKNLFKKNKSKASIANFEVKPLVQDPPKKVDFIAPVNDYEPVFELCAADNREASIEDKIKEALSSFENTISSQEIDRFADIIKKFNDDSLAMQILSYDGLTELSYHMNERYCHECLAYLKNCKDQNKAYSAVFTSIYLFGKLVLFKTLSLYTTYEKDRALLEYLDHIESNDYDAKDKIKSFFSSDQTLFAISFAVYKFYQYMVSLIDTENRDIKELNLKIMNYGYLLYVAQPLVREFGSTFFKISTQAKKAANNQILYKDIVLEDSFQKVINFDYQSFFKIADQSKIFDNMLKVSADFLLSFSTAKNYQEAVKGSVLFDYIKNPSEYYSCFGRFMFQFINDSDSKNEAPYLKVFENLDALDGLYQ